MGTAVKHPVTVLDRVKPSFVIFVILGCQKLQMTA